MDDPRPSLARTSMSSQATRETMTTRDDSSSAAAWEHSDIRGDVDAGWGGGGDLPAAAAGTGSNNNEHNGSDWGWKLHPHVLRPVPPFVPLESLLTRRVFMDDSKGEVEDISRRISSACQHLSIHVNWDDMCPSATLDTMERVEMHISVYRGDIDGNEASAPSKPTPANIIIEIQRRKGCPVTFHRYRRFLLDAAEGKFNPTLFHETDGLDKPSGRDRCNQPLASYTRAGSNSTNSTTSSGRPSLSRPSLRPPSFSADDASGAIAGLKAEGDLSFDSSTGSHPLHDDGGANMNDIVDKALVALNIAASLIKKDRVDARRLGMESLVLLTDPLRAGIETAKIASRVVLLGSAREDLNTGLDDEDNVDALFDESAGLGIRETILEMIMEDDRGEKSVEDDEEIEREFHDSLFNLCLTVLSNALHTMEVSVGSTDSTSGSSSRPDEFGDDDSDRKPSASDLLPRKPSPTRRRAVTEPAVSPDRRVTKKFIDDTTSTFGVDVLSSLIRILGQAKANPHDAYHSARCLGVLFKGCGNSHRCRARRDLDAKRIVSAALEVGSRTHAKLADASRVAMVALVTDDDFSMEEVQGGEERTELESESEIALSSALGVVKSESSER